MTTYTSTQSGNWSEQSTWGGSGPPTDGDIAVIDNGHTVVVDSNVTIGSNVSNIGHGITISGASAESYGKLVVNDGITLTMKGTGKIGSNHAMLINRYGLFEPQPGSRIEIDSINDAQTTIMCKGIIDASGTVSKPIIWSIPTNNVSWSGIVTNEEITSTTEWPYDEDLSLACMLLGQIRIANASGTGVGSFGDSSVSIHDQDPATICQYPTNSINSISQSGEYYIDHNAGLIYFYHTYYDGTPSFQIDYQHLVDDAANWHGWGIDGGYDSNNNVTYNELKFDNCVFEYMASMDGPDVVVIRVGYKKSPSVELNRNFYVKNSIFRWCGGLITFKGSCDGTVEDPIVIDGNTIYGCDYTGSHSGGNGISFNKTFIYPHSYITISNNFIDSRLFIDNGGYGGVGINTGIKIIDNIHIGAVSFFEDFYPPNSSFPSSLISGNTIDGIGLASSFSRAILDARGTIDGILVIEKNIIKHFSQGVVVNSYCTVCKNIFAYCYTAGVMFGSGFSGYAENVTIENNLFYGAGTYNALLAHYYQTYGNTSGVSLHIPAIGYYLWMHNLVVANNTFANVLNGCISLGVITGSLTTNTLATKCRVVNNLIYGGERAFRQRVDTSTGIFRGALAAFDYNLTYGQSVATYDNINKQATFLQNGENYCTRTVEKNITGLELWNPSYSEIQSNKVVDLTVNSIDQNVELSWNSGVAVQLVWGSGTLTSDATLNSNFVPKVVITDSSQSWSTNASGIDCPRGRFVKITSGSAVDSVGYIFVNTSGTITSSPVWDNLPVSGDTFTIYNSVAKLYDEGGLDYVWAGIDLRYLPTETKKDSGISITFNNITGNPLLIDPSGLNVVDYKIGSTSPAKNVGTNDDASTTDYWGTSRLNDGIDIGFFEYGTVSSGSPQYVIISNGSNNFIFSIMN